MWQLKNHLDFLCHRSGGPHAAALPCFMNGMNTWESVNPHVKFGFRRVWNLQGLKSAKPHFHAWGLYTSLKVPVEPIKYLWCLMTPLRVSLTFWLANLYHHLWSVSWGQTSRVSGFFLFFCVFFLVFLNTPSIRALRIIIKGGREVQLCSLQIHNPTSQDSCSCRQGAHGGKKVRKVKTGLH